MPTPVNDKIPRGSDAELERLRAEVQHYRKRLEALEPAFADLYRQAQQAELLVQLYQDLHAKRARPSRFARLWRLLIGGRSGI